MADQKISDYSQFLTYSLTDQHEVLRSGSNVRIPVSALAQLVGYPCQGRLTTESGVPVSTSDRTLQGTIYFTPYNGNLLALYTASNWKLYIFSELNLVLTGLTSGKNYDVFVYDNAGTLTLELSAAWTNDTTRADAITTQDGIKVKSGALTRRLIGTIRTTGTTTTEDSLAKRFIWNQYNQIRRFMQNVTETADTWTYTTAAYRQANANAANQLAYVTGDAASLIEANVNGMVSRATSSGDASTGIGIDSTSVNSAQLHGNGVLVNTIVPAPARYYGYPGLGYHFLTWLESSSTTTNTTTWYGDGGVPTNYQMGISGTIWN